MLERGRVWHVTRELDAEAEVASLKQQLAADELKTVQTQLESGNGASAGATPQATPAQEQTAHINERQRYVDAQESSLDTLTLRRHSL